MKQQQLGHIWPSGKDATDVYNWTAKKAGHFLNNKVQLSVHYSAWASNPYTYVTPFEIYGWKNRHKPNTELCISRWAIFITLCRRNLEKQRKRENIPWPPRPALTRAVLHRGPEDAPLEQGTPGLPGTHSRICPCCLLAAQLSYSATETNTLCIPTYNFFLLMPLKKKKNQYS